MATEDLRNTRYQYRLITVDVGNDPRTARGAIQRAIRDDRIDAITRREPLARTTGTG